MSNGLGSQKGKEEEGRETPGERGHTQLCYRQRRFNRTGNLLCSRHCGERLDFRADSGEAAVRKECQQRRHRYNHPRDLDAETADSFLFHPLCRQTRTSFLSPSHLKLSFNTVSNTGAFGTKLGLVYWDGEVYIINERNFRSKAIRPEVLIGINWAKW